MGMSSEAIEKIREELNNYCSYHDLFDCPYAHGPVPAEQEQS